MPETFASSDPVFPTKLPEGFLIIDKPAGVTSHDVVNQVRRVFGTRQVGHAGTLDPMATGVLVVAVGWSTRLLEFVVSDSKGYDAVIELGRVTDTDDVTGETLKTFAGPFPPETEVETALVDFRGEIHQRPPNYSAIKQHGQPVYKKARAGEVVELTERPVTISFLEVLQYSPPLLSVRVECGSGTYIRSLARDLGARLGCGGTLHDLRRWRSGHWTLQRAVAWSDLSAETALLPNEVILEWLPSLEVTDQVYTKLLQGSPLEGERSEDEALPLITHQGRIVAVVCWRDGQWWPRKVRPRTPSNAE